MRKAKLKWFTLIEMLIVMFIIGILAVVLTECYITVSKVALRVEQEKNLSEESLILTQVFQAISDEATIDYEAYSGDNNQNLEETSWFTNILYLTWWQWSWTSINTKGDDCLELEWNFLQKEDGSFEGFPEKVKSALTWCDLVLKQWEHWEEISLITKWEVIVSKAMFKVIPYDTDENYLSSANVWGTIVNNIHQPAFWVFIHLYAPLYQPYGTNKIDQPLQLFFNLKL